MIVSINENLGKVKFKGKTKFAPGEWIGIKLKDPNGRNNGIVLKEKYFKCSKENQGIFLRPSIYNLPIEEKPHLEEKQYLKKYFKTIPLKLIKKRKELYKEIEITNQLNNKWNYLSKKRRILRILKEINFYKKKQLETTKFEKKKQKISALKKKIIKIRKESIEIEKVLLPKRLDLQYLKISSEKEITKLKNEIEKKKNKYLKREIFRKNIINNSIGGDLDFELINLRKEIIRKELLNIENECKLVNEEIESKLSLDNQNINLFEKIERESWMPILFKNHCYITEIRERLVPLMKVSSFSRLFNRSKHCKKIPSDIQIINLIIRHFYIEGYPQLSKLISEKFYLPLELPRNYSELRALIRLGIIDNNVWLSKSRKKKSTVDSSGIGEIDVKTVNNKLPLNDINIWNEPVDSSSNIVYDEQLLKTIGGVSNNLLDTILLGNLNKLIEKLTFEKGSDMNYILCFLMTFRSFTTPFQLLKKLIQRFKVPNNIISTTRKNLIQLRVISVIRAWISHHFDDFLLNNNLLEQLELFLYKDVFKQNPKISRQLINFLSKIKEEKLKLSSSFKNKSGFENQPIFNEKAPHSQVPLNLIFLKEFKLDDLPPIEFARQLTLYVHKIFCSIKSSELVSLNWSNKSKKHLAPNILKSINHFNDLVGYCIEKIIFPLKVKERAKQIERFIKILIELEKLQNFDSLMAIYVSINNSSIQRLKFTENQVSRNLWQLYDKFDSKLSSENNYKEYRKILKSLEGPCVPYIGMYLTDLTFINDGPKNIINGLINFQKRKLFYNSISEIILHQQSPYNLEEVTQVQKKFSLNLSNLDAKGQYKISLEREPRNAEKNDILW